MFNQVNVINVFVDVDMLRLYETEDTLECLWGGTMHLN